MTDLAIKYLKSPAGVEAYQEHYLKSDQELELLALKDKGNNPYLGPLVSLIKLRRRAKDKFSRSEDMFFTSLSLEQATSEIVATYIASRFKKDWMVIDLTCGLGANAIFLAQQVKKVIAVDLEAEKINCARENAAVYGVNEKMEFMVGDAFLNIKPADAFFLDPDRNLGGFTKTRSFLNSSPSLLEILPKLLSVTKNIAVKISPAFDYEELKLLPLEPEVEVISENNNCKVAMLWFGDFKTAKRRATGFKKGVNFSIINSDNVEVTEISLPLKYLYEPDKAISKAHLVDEVAHSFSLKKLDYNLSFLTGNELINDPQGIFRKFLVLSSGQFTLKQFKKFIKEQKIDRAEIITKNFRMMADDIRGRLKIKEGGDYSLIFLGLKNQEKYFILAKKVG